MKKILLPILAFIAFATAQVTPYKFGPLWLDSAKAHGLDADSSFTFKNGTVKGALRVGDSLKIGADFFIRQGSGSIDMISSGVPIALTSPGGVDLNGGPVSVDSTLTVAGTVRGNVYEVGATGGNIAPSGADMTLNSVDAIILNADGGTTIETSLDVNGPTTSGQLTVLGAEGSPAIVNIWADEGDDNADKWRVVANTNGLSTIETFSSGSWVPITTYGTSGLAVGAGLLVGDLAGTGNRFVIVRADGTVDDTTVTIPAAPTFASTLALLGYVTWDDITNWPLNVGVVCNTNKMCLSNVTSNTATPPATAGTYLDNPTTYEFWNVFNTFEEYQRFVLTNLMVGPGN